MPEPSPSPHLRLVPPGHAIPEVERALWERAGLVAARQSGADAAGVVVPAGGGERAAFGSPLGEPVIGRLVARLRLADCCVLPVTGDAPHLAAAAINGDVGAGLLWISRRGAPFGRRELTGLRWFATGGIGLLRAMEVEREEAALLLQERRHRCANDLHLVGSLLSHQARFAADMRVHDALANVAGRVLMLARARQLPDNDLVTGLRGCCAALGAQVEERGIVIRLSVTGAAPALDERRAAVLLIAVNELVTNAVKHAFADGRRGAIAVELSATPDHLRIAVDDDGLPLPPSGPARRDGSGFDLVHRLVAGVRATIRQPAEGTKRFTIEMPLNRARAPDGENRRES